MHFAAQPLPLADLFAVQVGQRFMVMHFSKHEAAEVTEAADLVEINITPAIVYAAGAGVISVNGAQGVVVLDTDDIPEGTTNLYSDQPNSTTDDVTFNTVTTTDEFIGDLDGTVRFAGRNVTGATIAKGQVIYISGISGNTPEVSLAIMQVCGMHNT